MGAAHNGSWLLGGGSGETRGKRDGQRIAVLCSERIVPKEDFFFPGVMVVMRA